MGYRRGQIPADRRLLRDLADRVRRLENRRTLSVGPWSLTVDVDTGALVACHRPTGQRTVVCAPEHPCPVMADQVADAAVD